MFKVPERIWKMAHSRGIGAARVWLKAQGMRDVPDPAQGDVDGVAPLDKAGIAVVVIGDAAGQTKRVALRGFDRNESAAIAEAVRLAGEAWAGRPATGGAALVPSAYSATNTRRSIAGAVGVVVEQGGAPTGRGTAANDVADRRKTLDQNRKPSSLMAGATGGAPGGAGGGAAPPPSMGGLATARPCLVQPVAIATANDAENMFAQYRGAIVWINEEDDVEIISDFNGVRSWEIDIAHDRASAALASPSSPPYGGLPLFDGSHGAVGVYSQASSGSSSAGNIVTFCQDDYEANA